MTARFSVRGVEVPMDEAAYKLGLRVGDVSEAADFYAGLGFERFAEAPGPDGQPLMVMLRLGSLQLLVDALTGMPFADNARERETLAGPRGLGVVIGIRVDDVDAASDYAIRTGCALTVVPQDSPWGERYAEFVDPYGYGWKVFHAVPDWQANGLDATQDPWFGENRAR